MGADQKRKEQIANEYVKYISKLKESVHAYALKFNADKELLAQMEEEFRDYIYILSEFADEENKNIAFMIASLTIIPFYCNALEAFVKEKDSDPTIAADGILSVSKIYKLELFQDKNNKEEHDRFLNYLRLKAYEITRNNVINENDE